MHAPGILPQKIGNWRDIGGPSAPGGSTVASGVLYRSAHPADATAQDIRLLAELGIRLIVDLRSTPEVEAEGTIRVDGARRLAFDLPAPDPYLRLRAHLANRDMAGLADYLGGGTPEELEDAMARQMADFYTAMADDPHRTFGAALRDLCDPANTPALVHCSAGKDRTGRLVALVLLAAGLDESAVVEEYLLSNAASPLPMDDSPVTRLIRPALTVRPEYLTTALDHVRARHGSIDAYLRDALGVDDTMRDALRARLLASP
ncbi:tyrosine-protein phosphatase [Streptomyces sp. SID3343]|uniref:tyrosine-protein phosphatase n=1 Tax=Streptomyces sp. SID3343 TaxID=2690260 RepID=UPI00136D29ED|nr:tyrosine-protein phosphatase [Streptomyces sp. SID3343]MYV97114.1 hypothetical protein [Streptomyces sp. SID3343]